MTSLGVAPPVSFAEPTELELGCDSCLDNFLQENDFYEDSDGLQKRNDIVKDIEELLCGWVILESKDKQHDHLSNSKLLVFGGQLLGIAQKGSDVDAVCVVPKFITTKAYFDSFFKVLQENEYVTKLRAVEGAYVPLIKCTYKGLEIDLLLAIVPVDSLTSDLDLGDFKLLQEMTRTSMLSLQGFRETLALLELTPNQDVFKKSLKIIKLWAKSRGVYSSAMGYLGGMAWGILVARVCQLYPNACAATIINKFFHFWSSWSWPKPVFLTELPETESIHKGWDPQGNPSDRLHKMPIITPVVPSHNASFSVGTSNLSIITQQMALASNITDQILAGQKSWNSILKPINFMKLYKHFLIISAKSLTEQNQLDWSGLVECKLRLLVASLEKQSDIALVHLFPKEIHLKTQRKEDLLSHWLIGLKFENVGKLKLSIESDLKRFDELLKEAASKRHFIGENMKIEAKHLKRKQLEQLICDEELKILR